MPESDEERRDKAVHYYFEHCYKRDTDHYARWAARLGRRVRLRRYAAVLTVEGDRVFAFSPDVGVSCEGGDVPEALYNLEQAVRGVLSELAPEERERRRRKVYTTDFVIEEDPEYEAGIRADRRLRVGRLALEGFTPERVARCTRLTVDEVEAMWEEALEIAREWERG